MRTSALTPRGAGVGSRRSGGPPQPTKASVAALAAILPFPRRFCELFPGPKARSPAQGAALIQGRPAQASRARARHRSWLLGACAGARCVCASPQLPQPLSPLPPSARRPPAPLMCKHVPCPCCCRASQTIMQRLHRAFKKKGSLKEPVLDAGPAPLPPLPEPTADTSEPSPAASGHASDSRPASPPEAFAGWEAEEQLSACWGSAAGSFCSTASGAPAPGWPPTQRPSSTGSWSAGGQVQGRAYSTSSRPGSAGGQYLRYTVRHETIEEAPASGSSCAEGQEEEDDGGTAPGSLCSGRGGGAYPGQQDCMAAAWAGARRPVEWRDAVGSWTPGGNPLGRAVEAAEAGSGEGEAHSEGHPELEEEPSAPPLPCDAPWEAGAEAPPAPGRAVRFAEPARTCVAAGVGGGHGAAHAGYRSSAGGGSGWRERESPMPSRSGATWGAAAAVRCQALPEDEQAAGWGVPGGPEGFQCPPSTARGASASPHRQVSEETPRYQALLETLAERRREAAAAAAAAAAPHAADAADQAQAAAAGPARSGAHAASSEGEAPGWQSPLLRSPAAAARAAAHPNSAAPAGTAKWAGVQTLLGNLRCSASPSHAAVPPSTKFWDLPSSSDEREAPSAPAAPVTQPAPWTGSHMTGSYSVSPPQNPPPPVHVTPASPAPAAASPKRPPLQPAVEASPRSPSGRLLARWLPGGKAPMRRGEAASPPRPPSGLIRSCAPLGEWLHWLAEARRYGP